MPCCQRGVCFKCWEQWLISPSEVREGEEVKRALDPVIQIARRLVCIQCRATTHAQSVPLLFAPSQAIRSMALELRRRGFKVKNGRKSLTPSITSLVNDAIQLLNHIISEGLQAREDAAEEEAIELEYSYEDQMAIITLAQSSATALEAASTRRSASLRRAGVDNRVLRYNEGCVVFGNECHKEDENNPEYAESRNSGSEKDGDYIPGRR